MLRDGLALDLPTIDDTELGFAFLISLVHRRYSVSALWAESAEHPICLVVHGRHIDWPRHDDLCVDIGKEPQQSREESHQTLKTLGKIGL